MSFYQETFRDKSPEESNRFVRPEDAIVFFDVTEIENKAQKQIPSQEIQFQVEKEKPSDEELQSFFEIFIPKEKHEAPQKSKK